MIKALEAFLSRDFRYKGEVFNIGGGNHNTISLLELIDVLEKLTNRHIGIKHGPWRKFDQKVYVSDITKVKKLLKWKPEVSPQEGVARLYEWVSSNGHLFKKETR